MVFFEATLLPGLVVAFFLTTGFVLDCIPFFAARFVAVFLRVLFAATFPDGRFFATTFVSERCFATTVCFAVVFFAAAVFFAVAVLLSGGGCLLGEVFLRFSYPPKPFLMVLFQWEPCHSLLSWWLSRIALCVSSPV